MRVTILCTEILGLLASMLTLPGSVAAQDRRDDQFYYPGSFNWRFLDTYPEAARLFNAFDYGHAVLSERLYTQRGKARSALEKEFEYLTTNLLVRPPRFAVVEEAIAPAYSKLAWRAKQMFDWAHVLHRQIYDVYADERIPMVEKDSLIERLTDYYLSRKDYAFTPVPKAMELMDEQYFSRTFRRQYPMFNGLIWAYHWLQIGLYEPLIEGRNKAEKKAGVQAAVARFWSMVEEPENRFPKVMPMTSAIAPRFSQQHPRAAAIFDNLHMMHDIISDILSADTVPWDRKREVIYAQLDELRDSTRNAMSRDEWRNMGEMMGGVAVMGGPATGLLSEAQTPPPAEGHAAHGAVDSTPRHVRPEEQPRREDHGRHNGDETAPDSQAVGTAQHLRKMMELHRRMMEDSVIRRRVSADTTLRRLHEEMMQSMPNAHRRRMERPAEPDTTP